MNKIQLRKLIKESIKQVIHESEIDKDGNLVGFNAPEEYDDNDFQDTVNMINNEYKLHRDKLAAMGKEKNKYAQAFAKWARTQIPGLNWSMPMFYNSNFAKLVGKDSPGPKNKPAYNYLPIKLLRKWQSTDDPKYLGLLVYWERTFYRR